MEIPICSFRDCTQLPTFFCACKDGPTLLCATHTQEHSLSSGYHSISELWHGVQGELQLAHECLEQACQITIDQLEAHAGSSGAIQAISEEARQITECLFEMDAGDQNKTKRTPLNGLKPIDWVASSIENSELKTNFLKERRKCLISELAKEISQSMLNGDFERTAELYRKQTQYQQELGLFQESWNVLCHFVKMLEDNGRPENAVTFFLDVIASFVHLSSQDSAELGSLLRELPQHSVQLSQMLQEICGPPQCNCQICHAILVMLRDQEIQKQAELMGRPLTESEQRELQSIHESAVTDLAFVALDSEVINLGHHSLNRDEVVRAIQGCPFYLKSIVETPTHYRFVSPLIRDYVVAKHFVEELDGAVFGQFDAATQMNAHNLVIRDRVRDFVIQIMKYNKKDYTATLLSIVLQTRKRDDITQASANAITLLNQMRYHFAYKDFSKVKINGANLSGADFTETNFEGSLLTSVHFGRCRLFKTNFERTDFTNASFGIRQMHLHNDEGVLAAYLSPNTALLALGKATKIAVIKAANGERVRTLEGHDSPTTSVCFSPDSEFLASSDANGLIILWEIMRGCQVSSLMTECTHRNLLCFSPNGKLLASVDDYCHLIVWEVFTGPHTEIKTEESREISALCFSPDSQLLAVIYPNSSVTVLEITTGQPLIVYQGYFGRSRALCFSPDGSILAFPTRNFGVVLMDIATGQTVRVLRKHNRQVTGISYSADGRLIAAAALKTVIVWNALTGERRHVFDFPASSLAAIRFSPESRTLLTSVDRKLNVIEWDLTVQQQCWALETCPKRITVVCFSRDSSLFVTNSGDKTAEVWELATGKQLCTIQVGNQLRDVSFSPTGEFIVSASDSIDLWNSRTGEHIRNLCGYQEQTTSVCFSPDGVYLASGGRNNNVILWDVASSSQVQTFVGHSRAVKFLRFSPQGTYLASASFDRTVSVWNLKTLQLESKIEHDRSVIRAIAFSLDEACVFVAKMNGKVFSSDVVTGKDIRCIEGIGRAPAFSADSALLALIGTSGDVIVRDLVTDQHVFSLYGSSNRGRVSKFSGDSEYFGFCNTLGSLYIWKGISERHHCRHTEDHPWTDLDPFSASHEPILNLPWLSR